MTIDGLHHVTVIGGAPQRNIDFYTGPMAQRLVKLTVNFDDPSVYHLYYGNAAGEPGTIMTYFPFPGARRGQAGAGAVRSVTYGTPDLAGLTTRLQNHGLALQEGTRFGAPVWSFLDSDGLQLELVEDAHDGFHAVTLWLHDPEPTARLLTDVFGYEAQEEAREAGGTRLRLALPGTGRGRVIDLWRADKIEAARSGAGAVHHIAFRARDRDHQDALAEALARRDQQVTERRDRNYFESVYFREPGGILFEIATDPPGFAVDEAPAALGQMLMLPAQYEADRARIEAALPPVDLPDWG